MRESSTDTDEHRRSKPPRQSLRYLYRIELATLKSALELTALGPPMGKAVKSVKLSGP